MLSYKKKTVWFRWTFNKLLARPFEFFVSFSFPLESCRYIMLFHDVSRYMANLCDSEFISCSTAIRHDRTCVVEMVDFRQTDLYNAISHDASHVPINMCRPILLVMPKYL